jgi:hypothetical protein
LFFTLLHAREYCSYRSYAETILDQAACSRRFFFVSGSFGL